MKIRAYENSVEIFSDHPQRRYQVIKKPQVADIKTIKATYKNGILEIARQRKETETEKRIINFIINDLENKQRFIEESHQYKDYKPFFTDMWDAIILTGRHSLLPFETFEYLQHTYSWMKYYNTELDVGKNDESVFKNLLNEVSKSIDQSLKNLTVADK